LFIEYIEQGYCAKTIAKKTVLKSYILSAISVCDMAEYGHRNYALPLAYHINNFYV